MSLRKKPVPSLSKKITVQLSVCKRMAKEVEAYEKEVVDNEARVQKMRDEGKDSYDIRKQEEVLQESYMMVPDSKRRYEASVDELEGLLGEAESDPAVEAALKEEAAAVVEGFRAQQSEA